MSFASPRVGIGVFVVKDGRFLLGRRSGSHGAGEWSVPGGHLEFAESFDDAARREVKEEVNVEIGATRVVAVTNDIFEADAKHYVTVWVAADHVAGEPQVCEPDKFTDVGWYDWACLPEPLFKPWTQLFQTATVEQLRAAVEAPAATRHRPPLG